MNRPLRTVLVAGCTVGAVAVATVAAIGFGGDDPGPAARALAPPATAPVTRTTLTQTQQVNGTLGYGAPVTVTGRGAGTVTWLPAPGVRLRRGQPVYQADDRAVPLFYASRPLYRQLRPGDTGRDVKDVEQNLKALGYAGFTVDNRYTASTAAAVRTWQRRLGRTRTGVFDPADVVVAPGAVRVASLATQPGNPASGPVLAYAGTTRIVTVALDVTLQTLVRPGLSATVTLPDGDTVDGRLATVGRVATAGQEDNGAATIELTVNIADQSKLGTLDQAPVAVSVVSATAENVLTVPVAALAALAEGGYGVQVVAGSTSRYVPVQLGLFGDGRVEISGPEITEGIAVGVPS
ncbi:MAG TPA: peptidoglycan-binding domain-containing protein, partial [Asanoa sp.]|nr:peptidoglycan-binding domain-containing protein [Asanoa sp.]